VKHENSGVLSIDDKCVNNMSHRSRSNQTAGKQCEATKIAGGIDRSGHMNVYARLNFRFFGGSQSVGWKKRAAFG
jgi:hypothetical protein